MVLHWLLISCRFDIYEISIVALWHIITEADLLWFAETYWISECEPSAVWFAISAVSWIVFGMILSRVKPALNYISEYQYSSETGMLKFEIWNVTIVITSCIVNNFNWKRDQLSSASHEPSPIVLYLTYILLQGMGGSRWHFRHVTGSPRGGGIVLDSVIL